MVDEKESMFDLLMQESSDIYKSTCTPAPLPKQLNHGSLIGSTDNTWDEGTASLFDVRGANYFSDRAKYPSDRAAATLVDVDVFHAGPGFEATLARASAGDPPKTYYDFYGVPCKKPNFFANHPESYVQRARKLGDQRAFFLVHMYTGEFHMVATFVPLSKPVEGDSEYYCWKRFVEGDAAYRQSRLKIIPSVVEGPWLVKRAARQVPAIIGNKLACWYYDNPKDKVIEFFCDIESSVTATAICSVVKCAARTVILDLAFVIEAQEQEELPERILGVIRLNTVDTYAFRTVDAVDSKNE